MNMNSKWIFAALFLAACFTVGCAATGDGGADGDSRAGAASISTMREAGATGPGVA